MAVAVAIAAALFGLMWLLQRARSADPHAAPTGIYAFARAICTALTPALATRFWGEMRAVTAFAAERSRSLYTGNGQTYNLYIVYYLLALYAFGGGTQQLLALVR
jgi:hypothetical protein